MNQELKIIIRADGTAQVVSDLRKVDTNLNQVNKSAMLPNMKSIFASMAKSMLPAISATGAIATAFRVGKQALEAFNAQVEATREINAVLQSTGRNAEFTAQELGNMASALQKVSNYDDEEILQGATQSLLRYDAISKDMFPRVEALVVDMAKSMGGLENASKTLGISLADPILGMTRLRRAGVMLSESQQQAIKTMVALGNTSEAQRLLLDALESKYGGLAMAGINASTQLKNAWGDYLEEVGSNHKAMFDAILFTQAQFLYIVTENLAKTGNKEKDLLMLRFRAWADFNTALMLNSNAVFDSIINGAAIVFDFIKIGMGSINGTLNNLVNDTTYYLKNVSNYAVAAMDWIATGSKDMLDELEENKPSVTGWKDFSSEADKALVKLGKHAKDLIDPWKNYEKNFSTIITNSTKIYEKQLDLQLGLTKEAGKKIEEASSATSGMSNSETTKEQIIQTKDMHREMLSAWVDYYERLDKLSTESIYAQAALYRLDIETKYQGILGKEQLDELYNAYLWNLRDQQLAGIQEANQAELDAEKKLQNDKLSAQLAYLQAVKPYSQQHLEFQLQQYRSELQAYTELGFSKLQIDEMVAARRKEIYSQAETQIIDQWRESHEIQSAMVENFVGSFANQMSNMLMIETNTNNFMLKAFTSFINGMIYELTRYISKLIITAIIKQFVFGTPSFGGGLGSGAGDLPAIPIASVGGGNINQTPQPIILSQAPSQPVTFVQNNTNNLLLTAINTLSNKIDNLDNPEWTLTIDGKQLRRGLNRVNRTLNAMGT